MCYQAEASFAETIYFNVNERCLSPIYEVINKAAPIGLWQSFRERDTVEGWFERCIWTVYWHWLCVVIRKRLEQKWHKIGYKIWYCGRNLGYEDHACMQTVRDSNTCMLFLTESVRFWRRRRQRRPRLHFTSPLSPLAPPIAVSPPPSAAAGEPIWDSGVFTIIIIFFPYWWLSYNKLFFLSSSARPLQGAGPIGRPALLGTLSAGLKAKHV